MAGQGIHHCARGVSPRGMHGHTRRLVHHEQIFVFVDHRHRGMARHLGRRLLGQGDSDLVSGSHQPALGRPRAADGDRSGRDQRSRL